MDNGSRIARRCAILRGMSSQTPVSSSVAAPQQIAARVRAALAYAGLRYEDVDAKTDDRMTAAKLRRITSSTNPRGASMDELWMIADACGVPRTWLEVGNWDDMEGNVDLRPPSFGQGSLTNRVAVIERYVAALIALEEARSGTALPLPPAMRAPRTPVR